MSNIKRAIIFKLGQLGDGLISYPLLKRLNNEGWKVTVLYSKTVGKKWTEPWEIFEADGLIDQRVVYESSDSKFMTILSFLYAMKKIRKIKYNLFINLTERVSIRSLIRDKFIFTLAGVKNYKDAGISPSVKNNIKVETPEWERLAKIDIPGLSKKSGVNYLKNKKKARKKTIAMSFGAKQDSKKMNPERELELINKLILDPDVEHVTIYGLPDEIRFRTTEIRKSEKLSYMVGHLGLMELYQELRNNTSYIGYDSGIAHLAAYAGLNVTVLQSARDLELKWDPPTMTLKVIRHDIDCKYCMVDQCPNGNKCMNYIPIASINYV